MNYGETPDLSGVKLKMRIGVLADTHDNIPYIRKAVEAFNAEGVGLVIHCGDFIAPFSLAPLEELKSNYIGVFGNNDGDRDLLRKRSQDRICEGPFSVEAGGKQILIVHNLDNINLEERADAFDLILYGHTHKADIQRLGRALLVNPGEAGGWLYGRNTIAIVDLEEMKAEVIDL